MWGIKPTRNTFCTIKGSLFDKEVLTHFFERHPVDLILKLRESTIKLHEILRKTTKIVAFEIAGRKTKEKADLIKEIIHLTLFLKGQTGYVRL